MSEGRGEEWRKQGGAGHGGLEGSRQGYGFYSQCDEKSLEVFKTFLLNLLG